MADKTTTESTEYSAQVKWYNPKKNYGFATLLDTNKDIFIHKNSIVGNTDEDNRFWNKCLFEGELITLTLSDINGKITGSNIRNSLLDEEGNRKPLLFANPNMRAYISKFKDRWNYVKSSSE